MRVCVQICEATVCVCVCVCANLWYNTSAAPCTCARVLASVHGIRLFVKTYGTTPALRGVVAAAEDAHSNDHTAAGWRASCVLPQQLRASRNHCGAHDAHKTEQGR